MKNFLLPLFILLLITSCGKKRKVIEYGTESYPQDSIELLTELYTEHDSVFDTRTNKKTGKLFYVGKSGSLQDLKDSTYTRIYFYLSSGKIHTIDHFKKAKRDGDALSFYASGNKKSFASFSRDIKGNYESWYESGKIMIKGELLPNNTFRHREYFENGKFHKEMVTDKTGKGSFASYTCDGKLYESGTLLNFERSGIWKIYDSLGNVKQDTLYGMK